MAGKKAKRSKHKRGVVETVLVPMASTALVTTAAFHSLTDHPAPHANGNGDGELAPRPATPPETPSLLDRIAARLPFLKPVAAMQRRYGEVGGDQLAAAFTLQAFLSIFPLILVALAVLGFVAAGSHTDVAGRLVANLGLKGDSAKMLTDAVRSEERRVGKECH